MLQGIAVALLVVALVIVLLLQVHQNVLGNSETATKLQIARKITLDGAVKGEANFDGSNNIVINNTQNNIAVLNGKITLSNGSGSTTANYPTGFTYKNCIALAIGIDIYGEGCFSYNIAGQMAFEARLTDTIINIKSISIDGIGSSSTKNYRLVLMKI